MRDTPPLLIAGGGIGGLALALTLHEIGLPCIVFESVSQVPPLGVGINIQPNAIRELFDMGIRSTQLNSVGVPAKEWALVGLTGQEIYSEPRGLDAGYRWPQYAFNRGRLHVLLHERFVACAGEDAVRLDHKVVGYEQKADGTVDALIETEPGTRLRANGSLLIGADGIHSQVRQQMHPDQPPIHWGGTLMWRGVARGKVYRTGSSFIGLGTHRHRVVIYPISGADAQGVADLNWVAELSFDTAQDWTKSGWFQTVPISEFAHHFEQFKFDWLDVPELLANSEVAYENPMIDRDPVDTWVDGPVALLGDAAHAMYPTGSNGASQAIVDARVLGRCLIEHGVSPLALAAYDNCLCKPISELVLRNRGAGPFGLLNLVDERCGGVFEDIDSVIPRAERAAFMADYQRAAGFAKDQLNAAARTIPEGARVSH